MKPTMQLRWAKAIPDNLEAGELAIIGRTRRADESNGNSMVMRPFKLQQKWVGVNIETGDENLTYEWRDIELVTP